MTTALKLAAGSLLLGCLVLALKVTAWWITGSVALLSDALESIVNLATAGAALVAIRVAAIPPDANHPFGHHKAEFFSAVLEGVMIILAAVFIAREAYLGFLNPRALTAPVEGLAINAAATALNAVWAFVLLREGRRLKSPALVADGRHLWTDVFTSAGVAVGILPGAGDGVVGARPADGDARGPQHPLVGVAADQDLAERADGRGGAGRDPRPDTRRHFIAGRRRRRSPRPQDAARGTGDLRGVPPRRAGRDERARRP